MRKTTRETENYFWISLVLMMIVNRLVFMGGHLLSRGRFHYDLSLQVDSSIPFLPWTISIYFGCFIFWAVIYYIVARLPRQDADRFFCANLLAKVVCFLIYILFPTTIVRPDPCGTTVWDSVVRFLYRIDTADNLFPSIHCMLGWLCWVGVRGKKSVPLMWRIAALLMAIAVCVSTLTVRQHVVLDIAGGILLSEGCYWCSNAPVLRGRYSALVDRLARQIGSRRKKVPNE